MRTEQVKVDIIVPVYNVEDYLERCIESVLQQTYSNINLILIDDESTDSSGNICEKYAQKDCRVHVIHKTNGGVSSARNMGLEYICSHKSEWVYFLDSDDWIELNAIERLLQVAKVEEADIVMADHSPVISNSSNMISLKEKYDKMQIENLLFKTLLSDKQFNPKYDYMRLQVVWNKLIKKDLAVKHKFCEEVYIGEDTVYFMSLLPICRKVIYLDCKLYNYNNLRSGSATRTIRKNLISSRLNTNIVLNEIVEQNYAGNQQMKEILYKRSFTILAMMCYMFLSVKKGERLENKEKIKSYLNNPFYIDVIEKIQKNADRPRTKCEAFMLKHRIMNYFYVFGRLRNYLITIKEKRK